METTLQSNNQTHERLRKRRTMMPKIREKGTKRRDGEDKERRRDGCTSPKLATRGRQVTRGSLRVRRQCFIPPPNTKVLHHEDS